MEFIDEKYTVIENLSKIDEPHPELIETYGEDLKLVLRQMGENPRKVWTVLDHGKEHEGYEHLYVVAGYHLCNRLNYIVTEQEWENEDEVYLY